MANSGNRERCAGRVTLRRSSNNRVVMTCYEGIQKLHQLDCKTQSTTPSSSERSESVCAEKSENGVGYYYKCESCRTYCAFDKFWKKRPVNGTGSVVEFTKRNTTQCDGESSLITNCSLGNVTCYPDMAVRNLSLGAMGSTISPKPTDTQTIQLSSTGGTSLPVPLSQTKATADTPPPRHPILTSTDKPSSESAYSSNGRLAVIGKNFTESRHSHVSSTAANEPTKNVTNLHTELNSDSEMTTQFNMTTIDSMQPRTGPESTSLILAAVFGGLSLILVILLLLCYFLRVKKDNSSRQGEVGNRSSVDSSKGKPTNPQQEQGSLSGVDNWTYTGYEAVAGFGEADVDKTKANAQENIYAEIPSQLYSLYDHIASPKTDIHYNKPVNEAVLASRHTTAIGSTYDHIKAGSSAEYSCVYTQNH